MKKTFGDYFWIFLGLLSTISGLVLFAKDVFPNTEEGKWGIIFLGSLCIYYLIANYFITVKNRNRWGYAEMFEELNIGFGKVHSVHRNTAPTAKDIIDSMEEMCSSLSNAFEKIKGHRCPVCIKMINKGKNRPKVWTVCRDRISNSTRLIGKADKTEHWIDGNSDFNFIYSGIGKSHKDYYLSNNLPWEFNYTNTRLTELNFQPGKGFSGWITRIFRWPLPYKSTLVVPLLPLSISDHSKPALRGYLCIDSPKTGVFNKHYDVHILKGIADGLYNKIDKLHQIS